MAEQTITLTSGEIVIDKNLTIIGLGASLTSVSAGSLSRVFRVAPGYTVTIESMTIADGRLVGVNGAPSLDGGAGGGGGAMGAGLLVDSSCTVTLRDISFINNYVQGGAGGGGGGSGVNGSAGGAGKGAATGQSGGAGQGLCGSTGGAGGAGMGGGGGGSGTGCGAAYPGADGSYGGGGGGGGNGGTGPGGGGGASSAFGGSGASGTSFSNGGGGGGGAGLGAAVFAWQNSSLILSNVTFVNNTALGGSGGNNGGRVGANGQGKGAALFLHPCANVTAASLTFSGNNSGNGGSTTFAIDGSAQDNASVYGSVESPVVGSVATLRPPEDTVQDISGESTYYNPSGNGSAVPGEIVNTVYHSDYYDDGLGDIFPEEFSRAAVKFTLPAAGVPVLNAKLRIHIASAFGASPAINLWGSTDDSWSEAGLTFPAEWTVNLAQDVSGFSVGDWVEMDVTSFVTNQMAGNEIATFVLEAPPTGGDNGFYFDSSEDCANRAKLVITYGSAIVVVTTTTSVDADLNPSTWGQSVTLTATVTAASGTTSPTGDVIFIDGSAILGTNTLSGSGGSATATFATSALTAGGHTIYAQYAGDSSFPGSTNSMEQTVSPAALTITANDQTKVYGAGLPTLDVSYSGFVNGDTAASLTTAPTISTAATASSHVSGSPYTITASGAVDSNYTISYVAGSLTVTTAPLTVTAANKTKVYGAALPTLTASFTGFVNGDTSASLTTPPTLGTLATASSHVSGSPYAITVSGAVDPDYSISHVGGLLSVTVAPLTITADNQTKVYGASVPALTASYIGFVNGDTSASLTTQPTLTTTATASSDLTGSPYAITPAAAVDTDYSISYVPGNLTVTSASLVITANNTNKVYGAALPAFTGTLVGVTSNDAQSGWTATFGTVATASSHVGTYPIFPIFADPSKLANYSVTTNQGTLSIQAAALTIKADDKSYAYGFSNPVFTVSYLGLVNGDSSAALTTLPTVGIAANISAGITNKFGSYTITAAGGIAPDYSLGYATGILTVTKPTLTIIVAGTNRPYGQPNPTLISSVVGSVGSDNLTTTPSATATQSSLPGTYTINVPINDPKGKLGWYNQVFQVGTLTVTTAPLIGTVQNQVRPYGRTNAPFAVNYSGWVLGQDASLLTGSLVSTCLDTNGVAVGTNTVVGVYPISASGQSAANYSVSYQNGSLAVTQAVLNVTADNAQRIYGAANPSFTTTITGYVNGETSNSLGGSLTLTTTAPTNSSIGDYDIVAGGLTSTNYQIVFTKGTLTVDPAQLTLTVTNATKVYGAALPPLTGSLVGVLNNERLTATFHTIATSASPVAGYPITTTFSDLDSTLANYLVTTNGGTLNVTPAALTVTADAASRSYGSTNPVFTATIAGFVNDDSTNVVSGYPLLTTSADTNSVVGSYDIITDATPLSAANYSFSPLNGLLTVTQAVLLVQADNQSRIYGQTNPVLTATITGFLNADTTNVVSGTAYLETSADTGSPAGTYPITVSAELSATNYSFATSNGVLFVAQSMVNVVADDEQRVYGSSNPLLTYHFEPALPDTNMVSGVPLISTVATNDSAVANYPITIALGGLGSTNFAFTFQGGSLTVTQAVLTVSADNTNRVYGSANPTFTGTNSPLAANDPIAVTYDSLAAIDSVVSNYDIAPGFSDPSNRLANYIIITNLGTLSVTPAPLTVWAADQTKIYGHANPELTGTNSPLRAGDNIVVSFVTEAIATSGVGNYPIAPSLSDPDGRLGNYSVNNLNGALSVTPRALTVIAENAERPYGHANPIFTLSYLGFAPGDTVDSLTTVPTATSDADSFSWLDTYPIVASGGVSSNYTFSYVEGTLTVGKAPLTISGPSVSRPYGATNPVFVATIEGLRNEDIITASYSSTATPTDPPGIYGILLNELQDDAGVLGAYDVTLLGGTLTITTAQITGHVQNVSRLYGQENPSFSVVYSGWAENEGPNLLSGSISYTCQANGEDVTALTPVGSYVIHATGQHAENYSVQYEDGTLSIGQAPLGATAVNASRGYGDTNPPVVIDYTGFVNGETNDAVTVPPTAITLADDFSGANHTYDIILTNGSALNYSLNLTNGLLLVTQAVVIATADDQSRIYGAANPELTLQYSGFKNGQDSSSLDTLPLATTEAIPTTPVTANYPITVNGGSASNYVVEGQSGNLTIDPASLTVNALNQNRAYGATNPPLTFSITGFVNEEDPGVTTGLPELATLADTNSTAMQAYPITISVGSLQAANYVFAYFNEGTLFVSKADLLVTADAKSRLYGETNPVFTATISGFLNEDSTNVATGLPVLGTLAETNSPVGQYEITADIGSLEATNYNFVTTNGLLTIATTRLTVIAEPQERSYGATNPELTYHYSGFQAGDDATSLSGAPFLSTAATNTSTVGGYEITVDLSSIGTTNYALAFTNSTLTVTQAVLVATADNQSRIYGATNPDLTIGYTGFMNMEGTNALSTVPSATTEANATTPVGDYPITVTAGEATNYVVNLVNGTLSVTKATVIATADHQTKVYGDANPTLTVTYSNFVNGEDASVLDELPTIDTTAVTDSPVNDYPVVLTGGSDNNYVITLVNDTLTVTRAPLTLTAPELNRTYGAANPALVIGYSGFVNNEGTEVLTALPSIDTTADLTSPIGVYAITISGGSAGNYTLIPVNGSLTVTPSPLSVIAGDVSRTFGTANPEFTGTLTGVMNSDPITASYSSEATQSSAAGTYAIVPALSPAANTLSNYDVTAVSGTLTIIGGLASNTNTGFYVIGDPAVLVDTNATFGDGNGVDFNGATLTLTIVSNAATGDVLSIATGVNAGPVSAAALKVSLNGTQFGSYAGGTGLNPLVFVFNTNATSAGVTALMRQLTFATTNLATASREFQFTVTYGATSVSVNRTFVLDRPPVAHNFEVNVTEGVSFDMLFAQLVANSSDADSDTITVTAISSISAYGGVLNSWTNSLTYNPPGGGMSGQDLFAYRVDDGRGGQSIGIVTIKFLAANRIQLDMSGIHDAGVKLTMAGTPGQTYAIEASTNLVDWTVIGTTTATSTGVIQILDPQAQDHQNRYYRAVSQ